MKTPQTYEVLERAPSGAEFTTLIKSVGWADYTNLDSIENALKGSLFAVVIRYDNQIIGMGRLVGDGYRFVYIQDIVVLPQYQRNGVGSLIMDSLIDYINQNCPSKTYIHLFTNKADSAFYSKYGFQGAETSFYGMSLKKFSEPIVRDQKKPR